MPVWKRPNVSSAPLWAVLSRVGVTPESWRELPAWVHRAVTAAIVGAVLAVVLGPFIGVDKTLGGIHVSIWLLLILAGVLTSFLGVLIGLPTLRLRGDYLAIVTLGFGEILPQIARNGDNLFNTGFNLTNGPQGVTSMDPIGFGSWIHRNVGLPDNYLTAANGDRLFFWTAVVLVLLTIFCSLRLRDSRLGR